MSGRSIIFDDKEIKKKFFFTEVEKHLMRVILMLIKC